MRRVVLVTAKDLTATQVRDLKQQVQAVLKKDAHLEEDLRGVIQQIWKRRGKADLPTDADSTAPAK